MNDDEEKTNFQKSREVKTFVHVHGWPLARALAEVGLSRSDYRDVSDKIVFDHMPTPVEIAEQCLAIQSTWSVADRRLRLSGIEITRRPPAAVRRDAQAALDCRLAEIRAAC